MSSMALGLMMTRCGLSIMLAGFALIGVDALAYSLCLRRQGLCQWTGIAAIGAGAVMMFVGLK